LTARPVVLGVDGIFDFDALYSLLKDLVSLAARIAALHQSDLLEVIFRVTVHGPPQLICGSLKFGRTVMPTAVRFYSLGFTQY
jgi:hypothetical protein